MKKIFLCVDGETYPVKDMIDAYKKTIPMAPMVEKISKLDNYKYPICRKCGKRLEIYCGEFCKYCGQKIYWNGIEKSI